MYAQQGRSAQCGGESRCTGRPVRRQTLCIPCAVERWPAGRTSRRRWLVRAASCVRQRSVPNPDTLSGTSAAEVCASDRVSQARQSLSRDHVRAPSIPASLSRSMAISLMKTGKLRTMWRSRFAHASPLSPAAFPAWRRCVDPPYDVTRARETDQGARERGALGEQKLNSVSASVRRGTPQKRGTSAGGRSYRARATGKGAQCGSDSDLRKSCVS